MEMFRDWTRKQMIIGGVLLGLLFLILFINAFISDYESTKVALYEQGTQAIEEYEANYWVDRQTEHAVLDEKLLQSSEEGILKEDVKRRNAYADLQTAFQAVGSGETSDIVSEDVASELQPAHVGTPNPAFVYVKGDDISQGVVHYIGQPSYAYRYTYTDGKVDSLEYIGQYEMNEIAFENVEE